MEESAILMKVSTLFLHFYEFSFHENRCQDADLNDIMIAFNKIEER